MGETTTNTAWSIYWAPPSARFVTISARCDGWHGRRAITQFALVLQSAKLFLAALCKAGEPIIWRQRRDLTDLVPVHHPVRGGCVLESGPLRACFVIEVMSPQNVNTPQLFRIMMTCKHAIVDCCDGDPQSTVGVRNISHVTSCCIGVP